MSPLHSQNFLILCLDECFVQGKKPVTPTQSRALEWTWPHFPDAANAMQDKQRCPVNVVHSSILHCWDGLLLQALGRIRESSVQISALPITSFVKYLAGYLISISWHLSSANWDNSLSNGIIIEIKCNTVHEVLGTSDCHLAIHLFWASVTSSLKVQIEYPMWRHF